MFTWEHSLTVELVLLSQNGYDVENDLFISEGAINFKC